MDPVRFVIQTIINGVAVGSVYGLFALGYTLIFGTLEIINLAHAAVFMMGAFFSLSLAQGTTIWGLLDPPLRLPLGVAFVLGSLGAGLLGILIERVAFRALRRRPATPLTTLISSIGVALFLVNLAQLRFGADDQRFQVRWFPDWLRENAPQWSWIIPGSRFRLAQVRIGPAQVQMLDLIILLVAVGLMLALWFAINRSKVGKAIRAVAESPRTASLLGIDVDRIIMTTFFVASALGGAAGVLVGMKNNVSPFMGQVPGLKALAVIVLGGLGDITGAMLGGLVMGIAEVLTQAAGLASWSDAVAFGVMFLILVARPQGLLGRAREQRA
ncbi:MAG: branched-chain amino acid ABC transporter permease [Deinococcus sp.]|nr:branched-chain amino acid ABC transporter permease [Deinococcus sp.]